MSNQQNDIYNEHQKERLAEVEGYKQPDTIANILDRINKIIECRNKILLDMKKTVTILIDRK